MKKQFTILLLFYLQVSEFKAQVTNYINACDTIILQTGTKLLGIVTKETDKKIYFKNCDSADYFTSSIDREVVSYVVYINRGKNSDGDMQPNSYAYGQSTISGDFYAPGHETIKDNVHNMVSLFGHYVSVGLGGSHAYGVSGIDVLLSYSLAYKSHLFTLTHAGASSFGVLGGNQPVYGSSYTGFLLGESVRFKHALISLSAGIASSFILLYYHDPNPNPPQANMMITYESPQKMLSVPVECKVFLLARNGIGIGLHISKNILSPYKYSPFYFGVSLVFGYWNKPIIRNYY